MMAHVLSNLRAHVGTVLVEIKKFNTRHHWCRVDRGSGSGVMPAVVLGDLNQCNGMNTDMTRCVYIDVAVRYICMQAHRCLTSLPMQAVRHPPGHRLSAYQLHVYIYMYGCHVHLTTRTSLLQMCVAVWAMQTLGMIHTHRLSRCWSRARAEQRLDS